MSIVLSIVMVCVVCVMLYAICNDVVYITKEIFFK